MENKKKLIIQRRVDVWIEDVYSVDELSEKNIDLALDYEIDPDSTEVLWDSMEELGEVEVYDEEYNLLNKDEAGES